jgi:uncharacterized protein with ATP-grasp and redox domains
MTQQAVELINGNRPRLRVQAESAAREILADAKTRNVTSPEAASQILRNMRRLSGISDPFSRFKRNEMAGAERIFSMPGILPF